MDFKQLRYFVTVAEELHVGKAALRLHIAQPALSQQIQHLESQLQVTLFSREKRRLALTPAGAMLLSEARQVLQKAEFAFQAVKRAARGEIGQVKLGYVDSAMLCESLRCMLKEFKQSCPGVELMLQGYNVSDQLARVKDGTLDVGVVRGPLPTMLGPLKFEMIDREELIVCLPAEHRLRDRALIEPADLADEQFVTLIDPPGVGLAGQVALIGQEAGFIPRVYQYVGQTTTMACLVGAGFGVSILPASLRQFHLDQVIYRPLARPVMTSLYMVFRDEEPSPAVRLFTRSCRQWMMDQRPTGLS